MRALREQWEAMSPTTFVGREAEVRTLVEALRRPGSVVELVAQVGMGKTALLKKMATDNAQLFDGSIEFFSGSPEYPLLRAVDEIAQRLRVAKGHSLLIIDDADYLDPAETLEGINKLGSGPWTFSTVIASQRGVGLGKQIQLPPLDERALSDLLRHVLGEKLDAAALEKLWLATRGNPALARILSEHRRSGKVTDLASRTELLRPWRTPGLVGINGRPLRAGDPAERRIITDVSVISDAFLRQVADDPTAVFRMSSRRFEELVAELLERNGYTVTLTPPTRDGGKDMYAAKKDDLGSFLYVVECKRHAPDRPVGIGIVRALHGVAQHERVNAAMLMTTSYFSGPAREFAEEIRYQISLKDYFDLRWWLERHRRNV
jgi:restriction system protein